MKQDWKLVGKIKEPHGLKGEVVVLIFSGQADWRDQLNTCLISKNEKLDGTEKQFEIEKIKTHKLGLQLKLKGIDNRNHSEALISYLFSIPENLLTSKRGEQIYLREILGFEVLDEHLGLVGRIQNFSSNGPQDLLIVHQDGKVFEIPFVQDFIQVINFEDKKVLMSLPPGLLEIQD